MKNPTKEKAEEVVLKFMRIKTQNWFDKNIGKECALIYVNDIISEIKTNVTHIGRQLNVRRKRIAKYVKRVNSSLGLNRSHRFTFIDCFNFFLSF